VYRDDECRPLGANTDAQAVIECLSESAGGLGDRKALVLGAGGVSRAIAFALQDAGAEVLIANRTVERAQELATAVGCSATTFDEASEFPYDILVNGTSVGMREEKTPWPSERHRPGSVVFDTVYTPLETTLLQEAEAAQATCVCGMRMFINQALGQYFRWTGREAPAEVMQRAALEALGSPPGC
jgi:shikimate dehydrogenase